MMRRKKESGFTLIELMIVIAVIGILAVVLVPKMGNIKTSAKLTGVQTNYRSVTNAVQSLNLQLSTLDTTTELNNKLSGIFSGDNALNNPLSTTVAALAVSATDPSTVTKTNLIGQVYVFDNRSNATPVVTITAYDQNGDPIDGLEMDISPSN
ncbi:type II secretion system protein [Paradesulfitobacterium ferrireducens]|uniref:type II secretion system protein n=1 Tax=Paradesulfitobacterium ferrireducens TaxID=2816476 RepID=UPI001A90626F|nr:type II secretion system protein [Paradesulfitobacterium ferrireducens]